MAKIFISYSRSDRPKAKKLIPLLRGVYKHENVWWDEDFLGGDVWWDEILRQIAKCDVFVYLMSHRSLSSPYCQAELEEARRLHKPIVPVKFRQNTKVPEILQQVHYCELDGNINHKTIMPLLGAINNVANQPASNKLPLSDEPVKRPIVPIREPSNYIADYAREISVGIIVTLIGGIILAYIIQADRFAPKAESVTEVAMVASELQLNPVDATITQVYRQATEANITTQVFLAPTQTYIAEVVAMTDAIETQYVIATQVAERLATQATWTPTSTNTQTPTLTPVPPTATSTHDALTLAQQGVSSNADWTPYTQTFNGVEMVLVPTGCFDMGSNDGAGNEKPVHEICFNEPFWIDRTEVTQEQFRHFNGIAQRFPAFTGDNRPIESTTWFDAREFCELRDARLPTEAEWEYAARGVDELVYPWGNEWNANNAVWNRSSSEGTANVGSVPANMSWVGALDMSGNVWEWVSSLYQDYPYQDDHESMQNTTGDRVLRGGSWGNADSPNLRAAVRNWFYPNGEYFFVGFRCAHDYEQ